MSRSITCRISGKSYTFSQDYYAKKINEYGSLENLNKFFVTKKVKSLIKRGYNPQEIRNILHINCNDLEVITSQSIKDLMEYHTDSKTSISKTTTKSNIAYKTDLDVAEFINNIRNEK